MINLSVFRFERCRALYGFASNHLVQPGDSIRFDSIRFDLIRFDSIRFDLIRFDLIRFDLIWSPTSDLTNHSQIDTILYSSPTTRREDCTIGKPVIFTRMLCFDGKSKIAAPPRKHCICHVWPFNTQHNTVIACEFTLTRKDSYSQDKLELVI